jgi:hypothetical protein
MTQELVVRVNNQVIKGDDLLNMAAALLFGGPEPFRDWLHEFVDKSLVEHGVEAEGQERKAIVYKTSIELAQAIAEHTTQVCETAAAADVVEMEEQQLYHLLPSPYDSVQQTLYDRAEGTTPSSHSYNWATLARVVIPFAKATGAIAPKDLDPVQVAKNGNSARLQAAVPALRRIVQESGTPRQHKVELVQEVMEAVKDKKNSPQDIRRRFRDDAIRVPAERIKENGRVRWETAWMTNDEDEVGRRLCSVFLDFNAPVVIDLAAEEEETDER